MPDLTNESAVVIHMLGATSEHDWNTRCDEVKAANGGHYPPFWFEKINKSGLMALVFNNFDLNKAGANRL